MIFQKGENFPKNVNRLGGDSGGITGSLLNCFALAVIAESKLMKLGDCPAMFEKCVDGDFRQILNFNLILRKKFPADKLRVGRNIRKLKIEELPSFFKITELQNKIQF